MLPRIGLPSQPARLPDIPEAPASVPAYRIVETYMFDACTHRCGYCWLAGSGQVLDFQQLERFRSASWIDSVAAFFNSRTTAGAKWLLQFTGGEPLIAPNLDRLCKSLFDCGNRAAFYTALLVGRNHPGFRFLESTSALGVDYIMASLCPEAELDENCYFEKLIALKDAGHRVFLRFVGHPARLGRLEACRKVRAAKDLFLSHYPLSTTYPGPTWKKTGTNCGRALLH